MDWIEKQKRWLFLIILLGAAAWFFERWQYRREHSQDKVILEAATHYGMDPALVKAVVWRESRFNPRVKGRAGEIGLMQLRKTASEEWAAAEKISLFSHQQLYDPGKNALAGTWYLRKLLARYSRTDNPLPYALADYNAGRSHVLKWNQGAASTNSAAFIERIDFPSTKDYVKEVMKRYKHYRPIFPERKEKERLAMTRIENGQGFYRIASF